MRNWISFPHREGTHSRQAHADLPEQAIYERELGRSGFFGPATHMHHKHAPTDWSNWEGPLRPRAPSGSSLKCMLVLGSPALIGSLHFGHQRPRGSPPGTSS